MDGVSSVSDIMRQAIRWGHKGIAITDHGVVQAFTDAYHTMEDLKGKYKKKGEELDYEKASRLLLEEFRSGKLGKVTLEFPKGPEEA